MRTVCCLLIATIAFGAAADLAQAQQKTPATAAEAERLFGEGREALAAGDHERACARFRESLALYPAAGTLLNVAVCEERAGRLVLALRAWDDALATLPPVDDRRAVASTRRDALLARIPTLALRARAGAPRGMVVRIDGAPASVGGEAVRLDPGDHVVVAAARGHADETIPIRLADSERRELAVGAGPPLVAAPTVRVAPPAGEAGNGRRMAGWIAGGVGVAGFVAAGVTGALLLARDARIHEQCPDRRCSAAGRADIDEAQGWLVANAIAWGVGVAGVGAGAVLLLTSDGGERTAARGAVVWRGTF